MVSCYAGVSGSDNDYLANNKKVSAVGMGQVLDADGLWVAGMQGRAVDVG